MAMRLQVVIVKSPDDEEDCKTNKTSQLDWLAAYDVDQCYGGPVSRDCSSADEDAASGSNVVKNL